MELKLTSSYTICRPLPTVLSKALLSRLSHSGELFPRIRAIRVALLVALWQTFNFLTDKVVVCSSQHATLRESKKHKAL